MTSPLDSIVLALKREEIIPDVLPPTFSPTLLFSVVYSEGCEVTTGKTLLREDTLDEPDVVITPMNLPFANADSTGEGEDLAREASYTLVMVDLDAPSRKDAKHRQLRHWVVRIKSFFVLSMPILITNLRNQIPGIKSAPQGATNETHDLVSLKTKAAITPYVPPDPDSGSGLHRYGEQRNEGFSIGPTILAR